jgi:hypothetical protein
MTVIEVVDDPSRPPGTVAKELRRGFTWKGRLLRYAEVQAVSAVRAAPPTVLADVGGVPEDDGQSHALSHGTIEDADADAENGIDLGIATDVNAGEARTNRQ